MAMQRTPIVPNQLWKEKQEKWEISPPKDNELLLDPSIEQGPQGTDKAEIAEAVKTSDKSREGLDEFIKIACASEIHPSEHEFIFLVDYFISALLSHSDIQEWTNLRNQLDDLTLKYNQDNSMVARFFNHLDENVKFSKQRIKWQNFMRKTETFIAGGITYPINDLVIKKPAGFVYSILTTDKYWVAPEPKIVDPMKNVENWSLHSESMADSDDEEIDLESNENFDQMKEKESLFARQEFIAHAHSLGGLRKKFNSQARLLKNILQKSQKSPEIDRKNMIQQEFLKLGTQYQKLEAQRYLAIQHFSEKTKNLDTYLDNIYQTYLEIKEQIKISVESEKVEPVEAKVVCQFCAAAEMSSAELKIHILEFHKISNETPQILSSPTVQRARPVSRTLNSSARGSYQRKSRSPSLDSHLSEQFDKISVKNEVESDHTTSLLTDMILIQMKASYDIKNTVPKFNPKDSKEKEKFSKYLQWSLYLESAHKDMEKLKMTDFEQYQQLTKVLENDAKTCVLATKPESARFSVAKQKLDKRFMSKDLYIKELGFRLNSIEPMSQNDPSKMRHFVDTVRNIIQEFSSISPQSEDLLLHMMQESLLDKLNKNALDKWLDITEKYHCDKSPFGHTLKLKNLLETLEAVTKTAQHRQRMTLYKNQTTHKPKGKDSGNSKNLPNSKVNETFSYQTYQKDSKKTSRDPKEGEKCWVPTCGVTLGKGPNQHLYLCQCPKLKELSYKTIKHFFDSHGLKCVHCLSTTHFRNSCDFKDYKCKKRCLRDGKKVTCGKNHHFSLHNPKDDGILVDNPKKQPSQSQSQRD